MTTFLTSQNIVKHYAGVVALADGNLEAQSGQVVALIGANGSGKSTLCKIIMGVAAPDAGQLLLNGEEVSFQSPHEALQHGIAAVYQDLSLIPTLTVAENIWLNHEPVSYRFFVNSRRTERRTQELIDLFSGTVSPALTPEALVSSLSPDEQQIVEILKALSYDPKIMILDEATASLDNRQVACLFDLIQQWKQQDRVIIFISHRMAEIFRISDRVTVLRNGRTVANAAIHEVTERELVNLMAEREKIEQSEQSPVQLASGTQNGRPVLLKVNGLETSKINNVSFSVQEGEIVGIGGLQGQGQTDLLKAIFGAIPYSGELELAGKPLHVGHPKQAMQHGIAFVPGDRAREGLLFRTTIFENLLLPNWGKYGFPLKIRPAHKAANETARSLNVVMDSIDMPVSSLSGGNAQKIVIGKWLQRNPILLLLNDPTKGVDVSAKGEFYELLKELQAKGTAIVFYSSDDEELVGFCQRVMVMYDGKMHKELRGSELTLTNLVAASLNTGEVAEHG
jgi:ribose transport system ATP-binding protein